VSCLFCRNARVNKIFPLDVSALCVDEALREIDMTIVSLPVVKCKGSPYACPT